MSNDQLTVSTAADALRCATRHYSTESEHVSGWNFASEYWHCPAAVNDFRVGDGSMRCDPMGTYDGAAPEIHPDHTFANGRRVTGDFAEVAIPPEPGESKEEQRTGRPSILGNFRKYAGQREQAR